MEHSILLGQIWALYLIIAGVAVLSNRSFFDSYMKKVDRSLIWLAGAFTLFLGLYLVLTHNVWEGSWEIVVTVLGWLTLLKGAWLMLAPDGAIKYAARWKNSKYLHIAVIIGVLVGLYLGYSTFLG